MEYVIVYTITNVILTLLARVLQREPPFKINLAAVREYDAPFCGTLLHVKLFFTAVVMYMGIPMSFFFGRIWSLTMIYLLYWFTNVWWWKDLGACHFQRAYKISLVTCVALFLTLSFFFYSHEEAVFAWNPPLCWSLYTLYISVYYRDYQAKFSVISS